MPLFAKKGSIYIGALQCGAGRDAYIELELEDGEADDLRLHCLKPLAHGLSNGVDPVEIKKAVLEGLCLANQKLGAAYKLKSIGYIPNDSTHYDLHTQITYRVLKHLFEGGEFKEAGSENQKP